MSEVLEPQRLVFIDEMGLHTSLAPLHVYALKGERLRLSLPHNRGKTTTLLSSMTTGDGALDGSRGRHHSSRLRDLREATFWFRV